jgi:hypothetical protein
MTKTDLCNRALAVLGHDRTITAYDTDSSTEAVRCRLFFDNAYLNVLAAHNWDFAAVERTFILSWRNGQGYASIVRPADCAKLVSVENENEKPIKAKQANGILYVKNGDAESSVTLRWISTDTGIGDWPNAFTEAVVYELAAQLSGPMFGDASKSNGYMQLAQQKLSIAVTGETDETAYKGETSNPFLEARK